jgi:hypothetical protein
MKKFFLLLLVLAVSGMLYGCGGAPTKEEITSSVKQLPNFKEMSFIASAGAKGIVANPQWLIIRETEPKISGDTFSSNSFAIYKSSNDEMYIAFLDENRPPRIISIHKLK